MTYRLGREVTAQARAQESRGTVVVSLRLRAQEFDDLSDFADAQDRSISEIARQAIRQYIMRQAVHRYIIEGT